MLPLIDLLRNKPWQSTAGDFRMECADAPAIVPCASPVTRHHFQDGELMSVTTIITRSSSNEIVGAITPMLLRTCPKVIWMEGDCGSGKSSIAHKLAERGVGLHIEIDKFTVKPERPAPYSQCVKYHELDGAIAHALELRKKVILDFVCLGEVAPVDHWGRGLVIYVKRLSFNHVDPLWHLGFHLEDEPPTDEPRRSVHLYHLRSLPHMSADLIVEFPEDFHQLPTIPFSRERCFDPPNGFLIV